MEINAVCGAERLDAVADLPASAAFALLAEIFNRTTHPIFVKDAQHRWVLFNDAFCQLIGEARSTLLGRSDYDFFPAEQADIFWAEDDKVLQTGQTSVNVERLTLGEGATRTLTTTKWRFQDETGTDFLIGTIADQTDYEQLVSQLELQVETQSQEQQPLVQQIQEQGNLLNGIVNYSNSMVFKIDQEGNFSYISPNFQAITGHDCEDFVGSSLFPLVVPEDVDVCIAAIGRLLMTEQPQNNQEYRLRYGDGSIHWHTTNLVLLPSLTDQVTILGLTWDITDRKIDALRLYENARELEVAIIELQAAQTQLVQSEKMSSLGQLVAGVAHEINNPTSFIYGNLDHAHHYTQALFQLIELYQQEYPAANAAIDTLMETIDWAFLQQDFPKVLASMQVGAERIQAIVMALRNFSRMDESEVKEVNLHDGLESTLMILRHRLQRSDRKKPITIGKSYGEIPCITCYAGQLNQVFMNLLANAIDALDERDQARSIEEIQAHPSHIEIITTWRADSNMIHIVIQDNGPGIPDPIKPNLFNPFFTTKPVGKGTGMGLAISYQVIVEKHGGSLTCQSQEGQGTQFVITLPIA